MFDIIAYERQRSKDPQRIAWRRAYRNRPDRKIRERAMRLMREEGIRPDTHHDVAYSFWSKTRLNGDCLEWTAHRSHRGYGLFSFNGKGQHAHRVAWALVTGKEIPTNKYACHHCDNPSCVNPSHLFIGTPTDNMQDMWRKGRANPPVGDRHWMRRHPERVRGEQNNNAKLTRADVTRIRNIYVPRRYSARRIAREYGLHRDTVEKILRRELWGWL